MMYKTVFCFIVSQLAIAYVIHYPLNSSASQAQYYSRHTEHSSSGPSLRSDAGTHILAKVNLAKQQAPNYKLGLYRNVDMDIILANISRIISEFDEITVDFESQQCMDVPEEDMYRTEDTNCYAIIADTILHALNGPYRIVVGERAYLNVDFFDGTAAMYEFYLGPLYFGVYLSAQ
ncbi:uncharacterized protein LOC128951327 [Oppia nitens]|uniref:uncharacterized protein LOC128951327 n=1 Tax=Oppia nitens TaxID=1686743 RepID=UPI0023DCA315|nr:uncharacterized protein LOC128951327 [Oppia nitens]